MEGKLIKVENGYVLMVDNIMYATDNDKLSLKSCQTIANGYDLEELACDKIGIDISVIKHIDRKVFENDSVSTPIHEAGALGAGLYHQVKGFEIGFQKALELLGDKKFSIEDIQNVIDSNEDSLVYQTVSENGDISFCLDEDVLIQSLQQTEWDVEIEMECPECKEYGYISECRDVCNKKFLQPKLDAGGCLILKRK